MSLTTLRPILLALVLLLAGAGLVWWGLSPRIDLQAARADRAEQAREEVQQMVELQARVLEEQQRQIGRITGIEQQMRALGQAVTRNASAQSRAFEELKRHDQAIVDYLAAAVPAALGRLYQRPETTNPAAYRGPNPLSVEPVPPAGAAGVDGQ